jgi:hypothetical protein
MWTRSIFYLSVRGIYWPPDNATSSWTTVKSLQVTMKSLAPSGRVCVGRLCCDSLDIPRRSTGLYPTPLIYLFLDVPSFYFIPYLSLLGGNQSLHDKWCIFLEHSTTWLQGWASKFCFGSYIQISFRQELLKSLVVLRSECVFVST